MQTSLLPGRMSVAQALMNYVASPSRRKGERACRAQEEALRRLCHRLLRREPTWACLPVEQFSLQDWQGMMAQLRLATRSDAWARENLLAFWLRMRGSLGTGGDAPWLTGGRLPLTPAQWGRLLSTARQEEHLPCAPALGLMLWGGVSPEEVERLRWRHVRWEERTLTIPGGPGRGRAAGRRIPLRPILCKWLLHTSLFRDAEGPIVPRSWGRRWRLLLVAAGFHLWRPEALLLTFAACHARFFRDIPGLMKELGEAGKTLLPAGAASLPSVPEEWGRAFWEGSA